jgi:hypothetical protein
MGFMDSEKKKIFALISHFAIRVVEVNLDINLDITSTNILYTLAVEMRILEADTSYSL